MAVIAIAALASAAVITLREDGRTGELRVAQAAALPAMRLDEAPDRPAATDETSREPAPPAIVLAASSAAAEGPALAVTEWVTMPDDFLGGSVRPIQSWSPAPAPEPALVVAANAAADVARVDPPPAVPIGAGVAPLPVRPPVRRVSKATSPALAMMGKWVPHTDACVDDNDAGYLPLTLTPTRASAGDAVCDFTSRKVEGRNWRVVAECSDGQTSWTSNAELTATRSRLVWTSPRGTQTYVRCPPTVVAKAERAVKRVAAAPRPAKKPARVAAPARPATVRLSSATGPLTQPTVKVVRVP